MPVIGNPIWLLGGGDSGDKLYLFRAGVGAVVPLTAENERNATISVTTNGIEVNYSGTGYHQIECFNTNAIDLTNYSHLCVVGTITARETSTAYGGMIVASDATYGNGESAAAAKFKGKTNILTGSSEQTTTLDISTLSFSGYVGLKGGMKGTITEIYLEK